MSPVYLAFSVLPCPHPPNPLPNGKGEIFLFSYARGFAPCIPAPEPEAAQANPAEQIPSGGLPGWSPTNPAAVVSAGGVPSLSPANPAFSVLPCPHPPNPLPNGKGEIFLFSYARGFAPCIPATEPGRHWLDFKKTDSVWCRRRTPVAVNKNFEKSSWGFGGFFQEAPKRFPAPRIPGG